MDLLTGKNLVILGKLKLCFSEIKFKCGKLHRSRLLVNIISFCFPSNQVFASVGWSMPLMLDPSQMKLRCSQLLQNQSVPLVDNRTIVHIKRKSTSSSDCIFYRIYFDTTPWLYMFGPSSWASLNMAKEIISGILLSWRFCTG